MPITGWPSDSATHPKQLLECERSTPTGCPSGDRGWFRTELQLRPQDEKPRYAVRSPTSSVAPALSRTLSEGSDTMTTISAKSIDDYQAMRQDPAHLHFSMNPSQPPNLNPASTRSCEPSHPPASRIEGCPLAPLAVVP